LSPSTEIAPNDPTMSRLLREGYSTTRSLESVQPSNTTPGYERPSAMTINKHILSQQEPDEVAPQISTAAVPSSNSQFIDDGKKTMGTSKQDWKQTVKALGRPARHAPTPPAVPQSASCPSTNADEAKRAIGKSISRPLALITLMPILQKQKCSGCRLSTCAFSIDL